MRATLVAVTAIVGRTLAWKVHVLGVCRCFCYFGHGTAVKVKLDMTSALQLSKVVVTHGIDGLDVSFV